MSKRNSETWSTNNDREVRVSSLFGTLLYVSRVLSAAPVRLRRARNGWVLALSPTLAKLQRLFAVISNSLLVSMIVMQEQQGNTEKQARQDNLFLTDLLNFIQVIFTMLVYGYGVWTALRRLTLVRDVWRQLQKIKSSLMWKRITIASEGLGVKYLVFFIIWQIITCVEDVIWTYHVTNKAENLFLFTYLHVSVYYQYLTVQMLQLQWSITIMELKSTLTLLNDQLEELLLTPLTSYEDTKVKLYLKELVPYKTKIPIQLRQEAKEPECDLERIYHLNQCHGLICDLMTQVDQDNGPLILLSFMLLFTQLLTSPHSLITELSMIDSKVGAAASAFSTLSIKYVPILILLRETNWSLCHFCQLMLLVEPCHRLRDQMERTRSLLSKMMGRTVPCTNPAQLNLFVLQARMRDDALVPMGMFIIARPLLASIVGAVATYLMIVFQIQDASHLL